MKRFLLCAALALAAAPGPVRAAPSLDDLLKKTLDAYGGSGALTRARIVQQRGQVASTMRAGAAGQILRIFERPRRLRVEVAHPGEPPEVRVLDGGQGWRDGVEVSGTVRHLAMVLQSVRLDLPFVLAQNRARLADGGTVKRDGKKVRSVTMSLDGGVTLQVDIDPATGRILRSVGRAGADIGQPMEFVTTYDDFRQVGEIVVPFREGNYAQGQKTGETVLESVEILRAAPAGAFRP